MKFVDDDAGAKVQEGQQDVKKDQGVARAISVSYFRVYSLIPSLTACSIQSFIDPSLSWKDIPWFKSITKSKSASRHIVCLLLIVS